MPVMGASICKALRKTFTDRSESEFLSSYPLYSRFQISTACFSATAIAFCLRASAAEASAACLARTAAAASWSALSASLVAHTAITPETMAPEAIKTATRMATVARVRLLDFMWVRDWRT
eukprot:scaffold251023_cov40-Prasinocladus_malaysianus.AAC.2